MNDAPIPRRLPLRTILIALGGFLAFLAVLSFPSAIPDPNIDGSWSASFAYFFRERLHAGTDYIFTYGPLGVLMSPYFDPQAYGLRWLYEILLKGYVIAETVRLATLPADDGRPRNHWLVLFPLLVTAVTFAFSIHPAYTYLTDGFSYVVLVVLAAAPLLDKKLAQARIVTALFVVALLSLEKATLLALAVPVVALCVLRVRAQERPFWFWPIGAFVALWLALWLLLGQSLGNIAPYFLGSLSVSSGYNEAMAYTEAVYRNSALPLIVSLVALLSTLAALPLLATALPRTRREMTITYLFLLVVAGIALLSWKHGFTRGGNHTILYFLTIAFAAPFLFVALPGGPRPLPRNVLLLIATGCALFGAIYGNEGWFPQDEDEKPLLASLRTIFEPKAVFEGRMALLRGNREAGALPHIRAVAGGATVDFWSYEQGMLLLNDLNYRPHPSFQGYSDYTDYLQAKDITFWQSDAAPEYLVFKMETIDGRFPTLDGGPAFVAMLERYQPLFLEQGYLLMRRRPLAFPLAAIPEAHDAATVQTAKVGEWIPVPPTPPGMIEMVAIELSRTPAGSARALLYKPADVQMEATMTGIAAPATFRLLRTMAAQGFLLNPFLGTQDQVFDLYLNKPEPPLDRIRVVLPPGSVPFYAPQVTVRFYAVPFPRMPVVS